MTGPTERSHGDAQRPGTEIGIEFEIRVADGAEAQRLKLEQARALWEVTEWLAARTKSEPGRDHAA